MTLSGPDKDATGTDPQDLFLARAQARKLYGDPVSKPTEAIRWWGYFFPSHGDGIPDLAIQAYDETKWCMQCKAMAVKITRGKVCPMDMTHELTEVSR